MHQGVMFANHPADRDERLRLMAVRASLGVALFLIVLKWAGVVITGSTSLLATLIDSGLDLMASAMAMLGVMTASRPADLGHSYGHGKAESLSALLQGGLIIGSAGMLVIEAVEHIYAPAPVQEPMVGIGIAMVAIIVSAGLVAFQKYVVRLVSSPAVKADSLHYTGDVALNMAVIVALLLETWTGWTFWDPVIAIGIAAILVVAAAQVLRHALVILMDSEIPDEQKKLIQKAVLDDPCVHNLRRMRTRSDGRKAFIELTVGLSGTLTLNEAHGITDQIEKRLMRVFPDAEFHIHQEPDASDPAFE